MEKKIVKYDAYFQKKVIFSQGNIKNDIFICVICEI